MIHTRPLSILIAALLSGAAFGSAALAQAIANPTFAKLDANDDGIITEAEAMALPELHEQWELLDANRDDRLAPFEFEMYGKLPPEAVEDATAGPPTVVYRVSELLGKDITSTRGEVMGDLKDVVLESANGRIAYMVMDFGGLLGLGGTLLPLAWGDFTMGAGGRYERHTLHVDFTEEQLESLQGFDDDHWPTTPQGFSDAAPHQAAHDGSDSGGLLYRASELIGREVYGTQGNSLGTVRDVVLDWQNGQIAYIAIAHGGLLGLGEELLPLPAEALSISGEAGHYRPQFALSEAQLEGIEGFDDDDWPLKPSEKVIEHTRQGEQYSD